MFARPVLAVLGTSALGLATLVVPGAGATAPATDAAGGVPPEIRQVALRPVASPRTLVAAAASDAGPVTVARSEPEPAPGYASIGVTWDPGETAPGQQVLVRTRTGDRWSGWQPAPFDAEHGPDPGSAEAAHDRPGTDAVVVGEVDEVQVEVRTGTGELPSGLRLSVVDPGTVAADSVGTAAFAADGPGGRPPIFSRAQWNADEHLRSGSPDYGEVHAAFVHHTVNANGYTKAEVPAILRAILAYHTQSRGWSDIGYNFLVDRFGRIWEGRYGGISRPVMGAHTLGYNDDAFAMSAIGNFETAQPSAAMVDAYGRLFAWKLGLHGLGGVGAASLDGDSFRLINGHRDAASTACPGRYLYQRLPVIRSATASYSRPFRGRQLRRNVGGAPGSDLFARSGRRIGVLDGGGDVGFAPGTGPQYPRAGDDLVVGLGDVTGDRAGDLLTRDAASGVATIWPGDGAGGLGEPVRTTGRFAGAQLLTGSPDLTGDGRRDLVVRTASSEVRVLPGVGGGVFGPGQLVTRDWAGATRLIGAGDLTGDGRADLVLGTSAGVYRVAAGDGSGGFAPPMRLVDDWGGSGLVTGGADLTGDGRADLLRTDATTGRTWIYPGRGTGGLGRRVGGWLGWRGLTALTVLGDDTRDGRADVVVRGPRGRVQVLPAATTPWLTPATPSGSGIAWDQYTGLQVVGDWDRDGHADVMGRRDGRMWLFRGTGTGTFRTPVGGWSGWRGLTHLTAVGDWDGDGRPDMVARAPDSSAWLFPGRGRQGFGHGYRMRSNIGSPLAVIAGGLWNRDGAPDLLTVTRKGTLVLWPGNGPGGLTDPRGLRGHMDRFAQLVGVGDWNGDGVSDLVGREKSSGRLWVLPRRPDGTFAERIALPSWSRVPDRLG